MSLSIRTLKQSYIRKEQILHCILSNSNANAVKVNLLSVIKCQNLSVGAFYLKESQQERMLTNLAKQTKNYTIMKNIYKRKTSLIRRK